MATRVSIRAFPPLKKSGPMRRGGKDPDSAMEGKAPARFGAKKSRGDDGMDQCLRTVRR
jgi:hypothetical protein